MAHYAIQEKESRIAAATLQPLYSEWTKRITLCGRHYPRMHHTWPIISSEPISGGLKRPLVRVIVHRSNKSRPAMHQELSLCLYVYGNHESLLFSAYVTFMSIDGTSLPAKL
eukprot:scaffold225620_cov59-Attheya_sp.AAC.3